MKYVYFISMCCIWVELYGDTEIFPTNEYSVVQRANGNYYIERNLNSSTGVCFAVKQALGESFIVNVASNILMRESKRKRVIDIHFSAELFLEDSILQKELQSELMLQYPDEFAEVLKSAGNMHNPKLRFLYDATSVALKRTGLMQKLGQLAQSLNPSSDIVVFGGEKVQIRRKDVCGKLFSDPRDRIYTIFGIGFRNSGE